MSEFRVTLEFTSAAEAAAWLRRARVPSTQSVRLGKKIRSGLPLVATVVGGLYAAQAEAERQALRDNEWRQV